MSENQTPSASPPDPSRGSACNAPRGTRSDLRKLYAVLRRDGVERRVYDDDTVRCSIDGDLGRCGPRVEIVANHRERGWVLVDDRSRGEIAS